jgi:hypothetical protein
MLSGFDRRQFLTILHFLGRSIVEVTIIISSTILSLEFVLTNKSPIGSNLQGLMTRLSILKIVTASPFTFRIGGVRNRSTPRREPASLLSPHPRHYPVNPCRPRLQPTEQTTDIVTCHSKIFSTTSKSNGYSRICTARFHLAASKSYPR